MSFSSLFSLAYSKEKNLITEVSFPSFTMELKEIYTYICFSSQFNFQSDHNQKLKAAFARIEMFFVTRSTTKLQF